MIGVSIALPGLLATLDGDNRTMRGVTNAAIDLLGLLGPEVVAEGVILGSKGL
jgi:hypothetical protein